MSVLAVCLICGHQRSIWMKKESLVCSNCGVKKPRIVTDGRLAWERRDGIPRVEAQRQTYAGLKWLRDNKSYKPKWADARYRAIFGCWPPREIEDVPAEPPTQNLMRRVFLDNQHWKKEKRKEELVNKPVIAIIPHDGIQTSFMSEDDWAVKL